MPTPEEVDAQLLGPGGMFELATEDVLGEPMQVFKDRPPHLRALVERSTGFGNAEYAIFGDRRITYAAHARTVASVAAALRDRHGVQKGDRVAILAANCPEWIVTFWAAVSLGAIAVGLNGWWTGDEILYGLGDCEPRLLVADRKRLARLGGASPGVPVVEIESDFAALEAHAPDAPLPDVPIAEDDPAIILYTSGTTGRPKGAVQSHRSVIAMVMMTSWSGLRGIMLAPPPPPDAKSYPPCMFVTNPLFHVSGLHSAAVMALASGIRTVWNVGRFDAGLAMRLIERERITAWGAMNTVVWRMIHHPDFGKHDLSSLRQIGGGGAPTAPDLQRRMREAFPGIKSGGHLGHGYGSTESGALATIIGGEEWLRFPESVGRPQPTVQVEIRDPENPAGPALPEGAEGEVCVRSPLVMLGYWNRPNETAEAILPGRWLRMGDIGRIEDGRLYLASRKRDLILRGSENVYPVEIENRLAEHPDVAEAAVIGVPHAELGQEVKAVVVPLPGRSLDPAELTRFVAEKLAYYKVPSQWEIRSAPLPRNATGKVLKPVLAGETTSAFVEE
jgi:long-chain acyl-CoA synthetase